VQNTIGRRCGTTDRRSHIAAASTGLREGLLEKIQTTIVGAALVDRLLSRALWLIAW